MQRSSHDITERQAHDDQPVRVRSGETPRSPVVKPPGSAEMPTSKRGGATWQSATSSEACNVDYGPVKTGQRECRAREGWAKAMEGTPVLGAGTEELPGVW